MTILTGTKKLLHIVLKVAGRSQTMTKIVHVNSVILTMTRTTLTEGRQEIDRNKNCEGKISLVSFVIK